MIYNYTNNNKARATQSNQRQALFQNINVNWQTDTYRRDGLSDVRVTVNLMPDTGTDAIYGNQLWRMGLFASDNLEGSGRKYAYQRNVLDSTAMQTPLQPPRLVQQTWNPNSKQRKINKTGCLKSS